MIMFIDRMIGVPGDHSELLDRIIERLLVALLVFMPLAFGVVEAWSEMVVIALAGMMAVCFLLKPIMSRSSGTTWTWAYVPVIAFIGVILVQLIPFPTG